MKWDFSKERIEEIAAEFAREMEEKEQSNIEFVKSGKQDEVMEKIVAHLKNNGAVDNEDIAYFPDKFAFTGEEYSQVFDNLRVYGNELSRAMLDEENCFKHEIFHISYNDVKIYIQIMWGQGTSIFMRLADEEEWNQEASFTYEEFKENILDLLSDEDSPGKEKRQAKREVKKFLNQVSTIQSDFLELAKLLPKEKTSQVHDLLAEIKNLLNDN